MKYILSYFAACAMAAAATLVPGSDVKTDSISSATVVQGELPKEWEKDKVYILECWATWCGPCVKVIPHVNQLHKDLSEKGLRVIGMNVWEDKLEKVEKFVKDKGDGMSYPVAYVGRGGEFEKNWLVPAEVKGIPRAFVVKNGKLLFHSHPSRLTEQVISDLLAGGEKETSAAQAMIESDKKAAGPMDPKMEKIMKFQMEVVRPLMMKKDYAKAKEEVSAFIKADPSISEDIKAQLTLSVGIAEMMQNGNKDGIATFVDQLVTEYPKSKMAENGAAIKESLNKRIDMMEKMKSQKKNGEKQPEATEAK